MIFVYRFEQLLEDFPFSFGPGIQGYEDADERRRVWLATNYERPIAWAGNEIGAPGLTDDGFATGLSAYAPVAGITHTELRFDGEDQAGEIEITLPLDHPVAGLYSDVEVAQGQLYVIVGAKPSEAVAPLVFYTGLVLGARTQGLVRTLKVGPLMALFQRPGNTRTYSAECKHTLYEPFGCRVNAEAFAEVSAGVYHWNFREDGYLSGAVSRLATVLNVPEAANRPDGFFTHGMVLIEPLYAIDAAFGHRPRAEFNLYGDFYNKRTPMGGLRRSVLDHVGSQLTLDGPLLKAVADGARVTLYAGCDGQKSTCISRFANLTNFGGYPYGNGKNPMETGLLV